MTWPTCTTALPTWSMPAACSFAVAEISATMSLTVVTAVSMAASCSLTCLAVTSPSPACFTDSRMRTSVLFAASLHRNASDRTSSATTANPRPASPARAASTAASKP